MMNKGCSCPSFGEMAQGEVLIWSGDSQGCWELWGLGGPWVSADLVLDQNVRAPASTWVLLA